MFLTTIDQFVLTRFDASANATLIANLGLEMYRLDMSLKFPVARETLDISARYSIALEAEAFFGSLAF